MAEAIVDISLVGDKELIRQLSELERRIQKRIVRKAITRAARLQLKEIRSRIPVRTGAMRAGTKSRSIRSRSFIMRIIKYPDREELGIDPDDSYYYPAIVEYGTRDGRISAKAPLRGGFDATEAQAFAVLRTEINKGIDEALRST